MLVEISLQLGIGDFYLFRNLVLSQQRIGKFHLAVLLHVLVLNLRFGNGNRALHHSNQLLDEELLFYQVFEIGNAQMELLADEVLVVLLADEIPIGEQDLSELTLLEKIADFIVRSMKTDAARFSDESIFRNQLIGGLRAHE